METKAQTGVGNLIIGVMMSAIGLIVFIAGYPAWKSVISGFLSTSTNLTINIFVKIMPFFAFVMFIILFLSIFYSRS